MSWRRMMYNLMYRFGAPRWDTNITPPEVVAVIEGATAIPAGRALDLGCGTGTNVIYLARHGWQAVGVDFSPAAIHQARQKAKDTPAATFVEGDVSQLSRLGVDGPFDFVLDIGCFHGLPAQASLGYAQQVARVTRPGALFMIWAIANDRRPLLSWRACPAGQGNRRALWPGFYAGARPAGQRALDGELVHLAPAVGSS
jgi:SAM-dependent methyltransferase